MEVLLTLQDFLHMESTVIEDIRGEIGRREEGGGRREEGGGRREEGGGRREEGGGRREEGGGRREEGGGRREEEGGGRREEGGDTNCAHLYTHEYTSFINRLGVIH